MLNNQLFQNENDPTDKRGIDPFESEHVKRHDGYVKPLHKKIDPAETPAVHMIREKIAALYASEPNAKQEMAEVKDEPRVELSKYQKYMQNLSTSGRGLAEIQVAWHEYYNGLSEKEKHEVWQEFYSANSPQAKERAAQANAAQTAAAESVYNPETITHDNGAVVSRHEAPRERKTKTRRKLGDHPTVAGMKRRVANHPAVAKVRHQVNKRVSAETRQKAKHHFQALLFGLACGFVVIAVVLFTFLNQYIIAPFIQPSRHVSSTPLISVNGGGVAPTATPQVIIPKINVEIPLDFSVNTPDESQIEGALQNGVVHYPTTVSPGQKGNTAFFGHSSNSIFQPGKYKFAFALLHDLVPGDTFYLTYNDKVYAYQVFQKQIVSPNNVTVLNDVPDKIATATLITCDPPGTSINRLVVWGEQVSPDPTSNGDGINTSNTLNSNGTALPDNGPSQWQQFISAVKRWF